MRSIRFVVPGAPVPQARTRSTRYGRHFTPKRSADYQETVRQIALESMSDCGWASGGRGPFSVDLDVYRKADRGDVDNYAKALLDGMSKAAMWSDDARVHHLSVRILVDRENPRVHVFVREM